MGALRPALIAGAVFGAAFALQAACTGVLDAGAPDAAIAGDAGSPDAGALDAGALADAGAPDSGIADAGDADSGGADAGAPDAGTADAGDTDAGGQDAGDADAGLADAGAPDAGGCDPVAQSGCATTDKCSLTDAGGTTCEPDGGVLLGQTCGSGGMDDCAAGNQCCSALPFSSFCRQICLVDTDCTQPAVNSGITLELKNVGRCAITAGDIWGTCTYACNPVSVTAGLLNGCSGGLACHYSTTGSAPEETDCGAYGATPKGTACATANACAAGLSCFGTGVGHCRQVCRNATNSDCTTAGETCHAPPFVTLPMFGLCCPSTGC